MNFLKVTSMTLVSFCSFACSDDSKIGETLAPLDFSLEMTDKDAPEIDHFFDISLSAKRDGNSLKWKLVLEPTNYNKILSEELTKYESNFSKDPSRMNTNAIFTIKFLDSDGFVLEQAKAGSTTLFDTSGDSTPTKNRTGSVPFISNNDWESEVSYHGDLHIAASQFEKIEKARIECYISPSLKNAFVSIINLEKKKNHKQSDSE